MLLAKLLNLNSLLAFCGVSDGLPWARRRTETRGGA